MKGIRSMVVSAALVFATSAAADTITIQWNGSIFAPLGSRDVGVVTHPGGSVDTNAGRFAGRVTDPTDVDTSKLIDGIDNFFAYCHDLAQVIGSTTTYTVEYGASDVMRDFLGAVNSVLGGDDYAWLHPVDKDRAAAIQLGIWEALHEDDFNLATGDVRFSSMPGGDTLFYFNQFVGAMGKETADLANDRVMILRNGRHQDVITGYRPPTQLVPEPGTLALLGIGALVVATATRRRRR